MGKHLSIAYSFNNKCTKKFCKRTFLVQLIVEAVVTRVFWNTVYVGLPVVDGRRGAVFGDVCFFVCCSACLLSLLRETCRETFRIDGQRLWDHHHARKKLTQNPDHRES